MEGAERRACDVGRRGERGGGEVGGEVILVAGVGRTEGETGCRDEEDAIGGGGDERELREEDCWAGGEDGGRDMDVGGGERERLDAAAASRSSRSCFTLASRAAFLRSLMLSPPPRLATAGAVVVIGAAVEDPPRLGSASSTAFLPRGSSESRSFAPATGQTE